MNSDEQSDRPGEEDGRSKNRAGHGTDSTSTVARSDAIDSEIHTGRRAVVIELDAVTLEHAPQLLRMHADLTTAHPPTSALLRDLAEQLAAPVVPKLARAASDELEAPLQAAWQSVTDGRRKARGRGTRYVGAFTGAWNGYPDPSTGSPRPLPKNYRGTVRGLYNAGLPWIELRDAIDYVLDAERTTVAQPFRYVTNIGWKWIREARAEAEERALLLGVDGDSGGT